MRIGIIAHPKHPIAEPFAGGLESHTHLLASGLRRKGHDVTVLAANRSDQDLGLEEERPRLLDAAKALDARRIASLHDPHGGEKAARFLLDRADA